MFAGPADPVNDNCVDTDNGATDADGDSCSDYIEDWCGGNYDDRDFLSDSMCCICGGGKY